MIIFNTINDLYQSFGTKNTCVLAAFLGSASYLIITSPVASLILIGASLLGGYELAKSYMEHCKNINSPKTDDNVDIDVAI